MIFFGGVGTGKTTLAVAVMKEAMKTRRIRTVHSDGAVDRRRLDDEPKRARG